MDFIDELINIWLIEYKIHRFDLEYEVQDKDRKAVGLMLNRAKKQNPNLNSEEMKKRFTNLFRQALKISDPFLYDGMTLPFLNSQINRVKFYIKKENINIKKKKDLGVHEQIKKEEKIWNPLEGKSKIEIDKLAEKWRL